MQATLFSHLRVPKALLDMPRVRAELSIVNLAYHEKARMGYRMKDTEVPVVQLWEDDGDFVILPRGYDPPYVTSNRVYVKDLRPAWPFVRGFTFREQMRLNQREPMEALARVKGDKLLCLGCGKGKTVIALWYTALYSRKTIVLVDQDFLVAQWRRQIVKYLGIPEEEIGLIQKKTFRVGERITIAMMPTLKQRDLPAEFYDQFGLAIADEAHVLGAPLASRILPCFPGERLLLSATPERKDGMHPVYMLHGGGLEPCFIDLSRDQSSAWNFIELPEVLSEEQLESNVLIGADPKKGKKGRWKKLRDALWMKMRAWPRPRFQRPVYETAAGESEEFNAQILHEVYRAYNAGRNILVLGGRTEQLEMLAGLAQEAGVDASYVISNVKGEAREEAFQHRVIFATWQIASKALDIPELDTLILLFPTDDSGFLRQAVGRIDRLVEGKKKSVVVVFVHAAYAAVANKAERMADVIREIDPGARITRVKRPCLLPRLDQHVGL